METRLKSRFTTNRNFPQDAFLIYRVSLLSTHLADTLGTGERRSGLTKVKRVR